MWIRTSTKYSVSEYKLKGGRGENFVISRHYSNRTVSSWDSKIMIIFENLFNNQHLKSKLYFVKFIGILHEFIIVL